MSAQAARLSLRSMAMSAPIRFEASAWTARASSLSGAVPSSWPLFHRSRVLRAEGGEHAADLALEEDDDGDGQKGEQILREWSTG